MHPTARPCGIDTHAHVVPENFPRYMGSAVPADWPSMAPAQACHRSVVIASKNYRTVSDHCWDAAKRIAGFEHAGSTSVAGCPGKGIIDGIVAYEPGWISVTPG